MNPKVSIIVPVFNVEKYLNRSIQSLQTQTLQDIEIILVNDGSRDNSLSKCKEFEKNDSRIKIIDKTNGGVSSARNAGLMEAKGEYIGFIDPDDWVEPDMFEKMYFQIKDAGAELGICNYIEENNGKSNKVLLDINQSLLKGQEVANRLIKNMIGSSSLDSNAQFIMASVWRLLIKRDFLKQYNIKFEHGIPLMEDLIFSVQALMNCEKVAIINGTFYHYMINPNSAVSSYRKDMIEVHQKVYYLLEQILRRGNLLSSFEQQLNIRYANMYITGIINEVKRKNPKSAIEKIIFIKELCKDKRFKKILTQLNTNGYTFRKKFVLKAARYEMGILLYSYYNFILKTIVKK